MADTYAEQARRLGVSGRPGLPEGNDRRDLAIAALLEGASSEKADAEALCEQFGVDSLDDAILASATKTDSTNSSGSGWFDRWTWRSNCVFSGETELVQFLKLGVQDDVAIGWGTKMLIGTPIAVVVPGPVVGELIERIRDQAIDATAAGETASALVLEVPTQRAPRFPRRLITGPDPTLDTYEFSADDWSWDGTAVVSEFQEVTAAGISLTKEASIVWCFDQADALTALVAPSDLVAELRRAWEELSKDRAEAGKNPVNLAVEAPVSRLFPVPVEVLAGQRKPEFDGTGPHSLQTIAASLDSILR